jgi:hypothetical protein
MKKMYLLTILFTLLGNVVSDENDETVFLDKMYNNIINAMPSSQRKLIDSTSKQYMEKSLRRDEIIGDTLKESPIKTPDNNEFIRKMFQQVQENRDKRVIHFMSTDPKTDEK